MTTYTTNTVPLGGGEIYCDADSTAWSPLGSDSYIIAYQSRQPNHIFAQVVKLNGVSAPTVRPLRIIRQNFAYSTALPVLRIYGSDDGTRALVLYFSNNNLYTQFLTIDTSGNITEDAVALFKTDITSSRHVFEKVSDNKLFCWWTNTSNTSPKRAVLTVDWQSKTYAMGTETATTSLAASASGIRINTIPGGGVHIHDFENSNHVMINTQGVITTNYTSMTGWGITTSTGQYFPVSATRLGYVVKNTTMRAKFIDSGVATAETVLSGNSFATQPLLAIALDSKRFIALTHGSTALRAMVFNVDAPGSGSTSSATNVSGGLSVSTGLTNNVTYATGTRAHPMYHRKDVSTIVYWFLSGTNPGAKISFKVLYQPPT